MIDWIKARILPGVIGVAIGATSWGAWQHVRALRAERSASILQADLTAARRDIRDARDTIARLQAEADRRRAIDEALSTVGRMAPAGITDWLRGRAGRD